MRCRWAWALGARREPLRVTASKAMRVCSGAILESLLWHRLWCGHALDEAGLDKWRKATCSRQASPRLVNLFWEWLQSSTPEVRAQVLQFATGAARLPSNDSSWTFTISEMGSGQYCVIQPTASNGLSGPAMCARASTCAHMIALPPYADLEELRRGMERSLMDGGFGTA